MVDDGLFNWDTPVVEIPPGFQFSDPVLTQQVTLRDLVCACSGVPRRDLVLIFRAEALTAEDVVESLADFQLLTDFGETFQYSNDLLGKAALYLRDGRLMLDTGFFQAELLPIVSEGATREIGADGELEASLRISPDIQAPEKRVVVVGLNNYLAHPGPF